MKYLQYEDFLDAAKNCRKGEQIRVNHDVPDCYGTSKSMIIERKTNGDVTAYCFRCGKSGRYRTFTLKSKSSGEEDDGKQRSTQLDRTRLQVTSEGSNRLEDWPREARDWITEYLTGQEVEDNGFTYSDRLRRIIIPIGVYGYQTRRVFEEDEAPKYLTYHANDTDISWYPSHHMGSRDLCIVEDVISAIKCARYIDTIAIQGTALRDKHIKFIYSKGYNNFIIFFDDDNVQVRRNSEKCRKQLTKFGNVRVIHSNGKDPKEHSDEELEELLR